MKNPFHLKQQSDVRFDIIDDHGQLRKVARTQKQAERFLANQARFVSDWLQSQVYRKRKYWADRKAPRRRRRR